VYPYLRAIVSDVCTRAGFPPVMLSEVNFQAMYEAQQAQAQPGGAAGGNGRREAETRYEVDRTVRVTRAGSGVVKRLNAAVVVNHRTAVDAKGRSTTTPLSGAELEQLTALVRQGIGFDARRGDSVQVINAPFHAEPVTPPAPVPVWQQPWAQDLLRVGLAPAALVLVGLLALFGFVRPAMKAVAGPKPARGARLDAVVGDAAEALSAPVATPALAAPQTNVRLETARALAQQNPAAVANIMRGWVNGDAPA
ncbi:MAG: protein-export chaperone SecB, partial [Rubrivivax sp.]